MLNPTLIEKQIWDLYPRMVGYAQKIVKRHSIAEDVAGEQLAFCLAHLDALPLGHLTGHILTRVRYAALKERRRMLREAVASEFMPDDNENDPLEWLSGGMSGNQYETVLGKEMRIEIDRLPTRQREAIEILADGGTLLDVAREMNCNVKTAMRVVADARTWVNDGYLGDAADRPRSSSG